MVPVFGLAGILVLGGIWMFSYFVVDLRPTKLPTLPNELVHALGEADLFEMRQGMKMYRKDVIATLERRYR